MGILRKTSLVLGIAALVLSTTASRPASSASSDGRLQSIPALAPQMDSLQASKRASGPLRAAPPSNSARAQAARPLLLAAFREQLNRGMADDVAGLYLAGGTALHVVDQPPGDPSYVSSVPGTVTLFRPAAEAGTLGFLAHSEAGGAAFVDLLPGEAVWVIYGDGRTEAFVVNEIQRYQALEPSDPNGDFVDLTSGARLKAEEVFQRSYGSGHGLVLQTCLSHDGSLTWGRLFVVAEALN